MATRLAVTSCIISFSSSVNLKEFSAFVTTQRKLIGFGILKPNWKCFNFELARTDSRNGTIPAAWPGQSCDVFDVKVFFPDCPRQQTQRDWSAEDGKGNRDSVVWAPVRDLSISLLNGLFSFVVREPWWLSPQTPHLHPFIKPPKRPPAFKMCAGAWEATWWKMSSPLMSLSNPTLPSATPLEQMFSYHLCMIYFLAQRARGDRWQSSLTPVRIITILMDWIYTALL